MDKPVTKHPLSRRSTLSSSQQLNSSAIRSSRLSRRSHAQAVRPEMAFALIHITDPVTGKDATPLPLLAVKPGIPGKPAGPARTGDNSMVQQSVNASRLSSGSVGASQSMLGGTALDFGPGLSSMDVLDRFSSQMGGRNSMMGSESTRGSSLSSVLTGESDSSANPSGATTPREHDGQHEQLKLEVEIASNDEPVITEADRDQIVELTLSETNTFTLLYLPAKCVQTDGALAPTVTERNKSYTDLKKKKIGNDNYAGRAMQTFNELHKQKDVQSHQPTMVSVECEAASWDIYDEFDRRAKETAAADQSLQLQLRGEGTKAATTAELDDVDELAVAQELEHSVEGSQISFGQFMDRGESTADGAPADDETVEQRVDDARARVAASKALLTSASFKQTLRTMERMLCQNTFHKQQQQYRDFMPVPAEHAAIVQLWVYQCDLTNGRSPHGLAWNPVNADMVAVCYGLANGVRDTGGLVLVWTIKNPSYPERLFRTASGVTCVAFSVQYPNLLAVGATDGSVAVYDVRRDSSEPLLISEYHSGKHSDPVWQVSWETRVGGGGATRERLVSVSTDGRVVEWEMKKGLLPTELMRLKRVPNPAKLGDAKTDAFIARHASGMSFAFWPRDTNIYLIGTESGIIHKCSTSYSDVYLENFVGHSGAVQKLRFSPFHKDVFLSCSSDWTARLWHADDASIPALVFSSEKTVDAVLDVAWSPTHSTVFGTVTRDGWVHIWDLRVSQITPVVEIQKSVAVNSIVFSATSPIIICGDAKGGTTVYKLLGLAPAPETPEAQLAALEKGMRTSVAA